MNLILFERNEFTYGGESLLTLSPADPRAEHLLKILKAGPGSSFDAGIVNGTIGKGTVNSVTPEGIDIIFIPAGLPPGLHPLTLILGISRPQTVKKILKEATALGVERFILTGTDRGEKGYRESRTLEGEFIRRVLVEGAQQAFCTGIPETETAADVHESLILAESPRKPRHKLVLDNYEALMPLTEYWLGCGSSPSEGSSVLAVGSERGWSAGERNLFREAGFTIVSLGQRVLRTETAAVAGITLCLAGMKLI